MMCIQSSLPVPLDNNGSRAKVTFLFTTACDLSAFCQVPPEGSSNTETMWKQAGMCGMERNRKSLHVALAHLLHGPCQNIYKVAKIPVQIRIGEGGGERLKS